MTNKYLFKNLNNPIQAKATLEKRKTLKIVFKSKVQNALDGIFALRSSKNAGLTNE
jgi:hypothetical protein